MADLSVSLRITGDGRVLVQEVAGASKAVRSLGEEGQRAGQAANQGFEVAAKGSANLKAEVTQARSAVVALLGAIGGAQAIKSLARDFITAADAQGQLEARLHRVSETQGEYNYALDRMKSIAHDAYVSINSIAEIYVRSIEPMRQLGFSTKETLDLTEALSLSLVVSASDTQKRASAVDALSKVMQTGILRQEEFNTLVNSSPRFIDALEASLGKTRAQLIGMVADGKLTVAEIAKVGDQLGTLRVEVEAMPTTVEDAATRFRDAFQIWAGGTNDARSATALLVTAIDFLSKNIDTVMAAALASATAGIAILIAQFLNWVVGLQQQAVATRVAAAAQVQAAEAALMRAKSEQALMITTQRAARMDLAAAKSADAVAAARARVVQANLAVRQSNVAVREAELALGGATKAASTFGNAINVVAGVAGAAMIGVEIGTWARGFEEVRVAAAYLIGFLDQVWQGIKAGAQIAWEGIKAIVIGAINILRERLADLVGMFANVALKLPGGEELAMQLSNIETRLRPTTSAAADLKAEVGNVIAKLKEKSTSIWTIVGDMAAYERGVGDAARANEEFARTGNVSARTVDAALADLTKRMAGQDVQLKEQIATHGKGKAAALEYARSIDLAKAATIDDLEARARYIAGVNATYEPLIALASNLDSVTRSQKSSAEEAKKAREAAADYIKDLEKQVATYGMTADALARYEMGLQKLTPEQRTQASALLDTLAEWARYAAALKPAYDAIDEILGGSADLDEQLAQGRDTLAGLTPAQVKYNASVREANKLTREALALGPMTAEQQKVLEDRLRKLAELRDQDADIDAGASASSNLDQILSRLEEKSPFQQSIDDLASLREALEALGDPLDEAFDTARADRLTAAINKTRTQLATQFVGAAKESLQSIQSMTSEGSRAFQVLQVAIDATTVAEAVLALVHQLSAGDVYTAIPRMVAVAAAIASLGVSVGNVAGGGFSDTAKQRQETQGTGSVLGDATADSESIANGVEITANATSELVAINRGMLRALIALQAGIGSAATMLARGAGDADFSGFNLASKSFDFKDPLTQAILGGSSKITDQGIVIFGGALSEMLEGIRVGLYQEVQSRSWAFGSTRTREAVTDASDEFGFQFQLIIASIAGTVRQGALALGMLPAEIDAAMAAYKVEEIRISLKGLSAEEQQAELTAVFGKIFDGLAGSVVPFLPQFQRMGEGLGETLIRVATSVQVAQEAVRQLGFALDETDPERVAQISVELIDLAGGIDEFINGMSNFVNAFAPESHKFTVASEALNSAFAQAGLTVPATEKGMWDLMQTLDATTAEGREQIATLLRLSGVAKEYYDLLESKVSDATKYLEELGLGGVDVSEFTASIMEIRASGLKAAEAANTLAVAQGRASASTMQMSRIRQWTLDQEAAAIRRLSMQMQDLIAQLYGGMPASLDLINTRIGELEGAAGGVADGIGSVEDASASLFEAWRNGVQSVQQYLDSMLLGENTNLAPEEQLAEAQRQLMAMQASAVGGNADALNQLPQMADAYLRLLRGSGASGGDWDTGVEWVRDLLKSVVDMQNPGTPGGAGNPTPVELVPSAELRDLYAARDAAMAEQDKAQRAEWARQLIQNLADMATLMKIPTLTFIEAQGLALVDLATDLGVDLENLGASSVNALGFMASTLGVSMTELTSSLGISLVDLRGGLTELTDRVGIDLSALTVETTQTLAALAGSLGMDLSELESSLGISLGSIRDANSLINQALGAEIGTLPQDQRDALEPLLTAITAATTEADANAAIAQLEAAVNDIGGLTAQALAPYLAGVMPARALDQLDYLGEIQAIAAQQLDVLGLIRDNLKAANIAAGAPSYAVGTGYVRGDQLANIHNAEAVVPANVNAWFRTANWQLPRASSNDDGATVAELRALRDEVAALRRENAAGHSKTAQNVAEGESKARTQRDDIARRTQDTARSKSA